MADQLDSDSAPQRKRIAVACGRCRKRKIRCSGDPGQGQPCVNCKNAGVDQCQFLRVSSREAPLRHDTGDFGYNIGDARMYANRTPVGGGIPYTQDLPTLGSSDMLGSYRNGPSYTYTPASKAYFPAMPAYGTPYAEELDFGLGVPGPSSMNTESVGMMPGQWSSAARPKPPSYASVYMDTDGPYSGYSGAGLLHRPPNAVSSESPSFSFSGVTASLPLASTPGPDRLLPNPVGRPSAMQYAPGLKSPVHTASASSNLADVATAATYVGGFETPGLSFSSTSLSSHPSLSSRANSDAAYSGSEGIFSEQERGIQSQGPSFDLNGYTASGSPRRGSGAGSGVGGPSNGSGHGYMPGQSAHEVAAHQTQQQHSPPHHHQGHLSAGATYLRDAPANPPSQHHGLPTVPLTASRAGSAGGHAAHIDNKQGAVAGRH